MRTKEANTGHEGSSRKLEIPGAWLRSLTPTERAPSVGHMSVDRLIKDGVQLLIFDLEGTVVEQDGIDMDPAAKALTDEARAKGLTVAAATNKIPEDYMSFLKMSWLGEQMGAEVVVSPLSGEERKPSSQMPLMIMQRFGFRPEQTWMVGDKMSADIRAANYAGIRSTLVDRLGERDLVGDKYGRRPPEAALKVFLKLFRFPDFPPKPPAARALEWLQNEDVSQNHWVSLNGNIDYSSFPEDFYLLGERLRGYGGPHIELDPGVKEFIPDPWHSSVTGKLMSFLENDRFEEFVKEHGRAVADFMTAARVPGAFLVAGLILDGDFKNAKRLHRALTATDAADGWFARHSRDGITEKGGKDDQEADKIYTLVVGLALVLKGRLDPYDFAVQFTRDHVVMNKILRPIYKKMGIDTRAVLATKVSTVGVITAYDAAMSKWAGKHEEGNDLLQTAATGLKVYSAAKSPADWEIRDEWEKYELKRLIEVEKELRRRKGLPERSYLEEQSKVA